MTRILIAVCFLTQLAAAQLFTIGQQPNDDNLRQVDPTTGATLATIPVTGANGVGFNAMAQDPVTDRVYVVEGGNNSTMRTLGLIDVVTGAYTAIGSTGLSINSLAFTPDGTLFALDGILGTQGDLYTLDKATGAATFLVNTGLSGLGTSLMFDPATGMLVAYGGCPSGSGTFIDPVTLALTAPPALPMTGSEIQGGAPSVAGDIFVTDFSDLFRITSAGGSVLVGPLGHGARGIVEFAVRTNAPGTGDDLESLYVLNGGPVTTVGASTDVITLLPGDALTFGHVSPGGTYTQFGDLASVGSILPGGLAAPVLFPGLHINIATAFVLSQPVGGFPPQLPATGFSFAFTYTGGLAAGLDLLLQGFVISGPPATNGIFASTPAARIELR